MATLVTGGTGFIGSNILKVLAAQGHEVVSFDIAPPDRLVHSFIEPWADQIRFLQGDILKQSDLQQLTNYEITDIIHAAVHTGVLPGIESTRSRSIVEINTMGTTNLLEVARILSPRRFLYVSSVSVYGDRQSSNQPLDEESAVNPHTLYSLTKFTSELLTRRYGELFNFDTVSTRLDGPYGPMERVTSHRVNQSLVKEWTGKAIRGEPIKLDNINAQVELTYVSDVAEGIRTVLEAPHLSYDVYNISSGEVFCLRDVAGFLTKIFPKLEVSEVHQAEGSTQRETQFIGNQGVSRLREDLHFIHQYDLESGLREYVEWCRSTQFIE